MAAAAALTAKRRDELGRHAAALLVSLQRARRKGDQLAEALFEDQLNAVLDEMNPPKEASNA